MVLTDALRRLPRRRSTCRPCVPAALAHLHVGIHAQVLLYTAFSHACGRIAVARSLWHPAVATRH